MHSEECAPKELIEMAEAVFVLQKSLLNQKNCILAYSAQETCDCVQATSIKNFVVKSAFC